MLLYITLAITILSSGYILAKFILDLLLRGFAPFIPARPWVVEATANNLKLKKYECAYALGSGRSGFIHEFEKLFPDSRVFAVEYDRFPFLVASSQILIRKLLGSSRIKIIKSSIHRLNISDADFIYCHLYPEQMGGLGKKLKFECRPGIQVVSNGFLIPDLEIKRTVDLPEKKGRLSWLSRNKGLLFKSKQKKSRKENKVFFYEI